MIEDFFACFNTDRFDDTTEMLLDENGLFYHSYEYGVTIIIPPGAVQQQCTLQFGSCLVLPHFISNDSFVPVSPFVRIDIDIVLLKPAELYIPHYVDIRSDKHRKKLFVLSTKDNTSEKEIFTVNTEASVSFSPTLATIHTTHFCLTCIATKSKNPPPKRYHLLFAEKKDEIGGLHVDMCIMYHIKCLEVTKFN